MTYCSPGIFHHTIMLDGKSYYCELLQECYKFEHDPLDLIFYWMLTLSTFFKGFKGLNNLSTQRRRGISQTYSPTKGGGRDKFILSQDTGIF